MNISYLLFQLDKLNKNLNKDKNKLPIEIINFIKNILEILLKMQNDNKSNQNSNDQKFKLHN